jgi:hypothetical protein
VGVPRAHRDLEELLRSCGRVEMSAGHGEPLTAALRPGLEKNRSVGGYRGLELALGGANDWWGLGEAGSRGSGMEKLRQW